MKILIIGANRGLGKEITMQLLSNLPKDRSLYISARSPSKLAEAMAGVKEAFGEDCAQVKPCILDLEEKDQGNLLKNIKRLPSVNYVFHIASPYSQTPLLKTKPEELQGWLTTEMNEVLLLSELAKKLALGGCLLATGAIIGRINGGENVRQSHPWYIGLSSHHKGLLRVTMSSLFQEMPHHRIIHANIGAFRDEKDFKDDVARGDALSTQSLATQLIELAFSSQKLKGFSVDFMTKKELQEMEASKVAAYLPQEEPKPPAQLGMGGDYSRLGIKG